MTGFLLCLRIQEFTTSATFFEVWSNSTKWVKTNRDHQIWTKRNKSRSSVKCLFFSKCKLHKPSTRTWKTYEQYEPDTPDGKCHSHHDFFLNFAQVAEAVFTSPPSALLVFAIYHSFRSSPSLWNQMILRKDADSRGRSQTPQNKETGSCCATSAAHE